MSPEQIAQDRELDIAAVKAALSQSSAAFRTVCRRDITDEDLNFTNEESLLVKNQLLQLALTSEHDHIRLSASKYIRDDKKGRLDAAAKMPTFNILMINETLRKAREQTQAVKQQVLVDV